MLTNRLTAQSKHYDLIATYRSLPHTFQFTVEILFYTYENCCTESGVCEISGVDLDDEAFLASAAKDEFCVACPRKLCRADAGSSYMATDIPSEGVVRSDTLAQSIIRDAVSSMDHNGWHDEEMRELFQIPWGRADG